MHAYEYCYRQSPMGLSILADKAMQCGDGRVSTTTAASPPHIPMIFEEEEDTSKR
jgi:hypothetical protein